MHFHAHTPTGHNRRKRLKARKGIAMVSASPSLKRQRFDALSVRWTGPLVRYFFPAHPLHCGLSAPPTASQASVSGVARETQDML